MNENGLTITIPDLATLKQHWLLVVLIGNGIYGIVTHIYSVKQINNWNEMIRETNGRRWESIKGISPGIMLVLLLFRTTIQLPIRIIAAILGTIHGLLLSLACGKIVISDTLKWGWRWQSKPQDVREFF